MIRQTIFLLLLILPRLWHGRCGSFDDDAECERLCLQYDILPSLWEGCRDAMRSNDRKTWTGNACSSRLSQSCKPWSSVTNPNPHPILDWEKTCLATFGGANTSEELVLLTVASRPSAMFGLLMKSVISHNIKTIVIGWDFFSNDSEGKEKYEKRKHAKFYSGYKVVALYLLLKTCHRRGYLKTDLYIMFVDGTDSVFQRGPDYILKNVRRLGAPIIFSTERNMFPATEHIKSIYPRSYQAPIKTIFGHLNTGGWVGMSGPLLQWYREWANAPYVSYTKPHGKKKLVLDTPQPKKMYRSVEEIWNNRNLDASSPELPRVFRAGDQFNAAHMYLDGVANASVDSFASLFISMCIPTREHDKFFNFVQSKMNDSYAQETSLKIESLRTRSHPAVMHYNGPAKQQFCGDRGATSVFNSNLTENIIEAALQQDRLTFLNAGLALLPRGVVSVALIEISSTSRRMKCKRECI